MRWSLCTLAYSANPPPERRAMTLLVVTVSFSTRYPAHSRPMISEAPGGAGYLPYDYSKSALFRPVAFT